MIRSAGLLLLLVVGRRQADREVGGGAVLGDEVLAICVSQVAGDAGDVVVGLDLPLDLLDPLRARRRRCGSASSTRTITLASRKPAASSRSSADRRSRCRDRRRRRGRAGRRPSRRARPRARRGRRPMHDQLAAALGQACECVEHQTSSCRRRGQLGQRHVLSRSRRLPLEPLRDPFVQLDPEAEHRVRRPGPCPRRPSARRRAARRPPRRLTSARSRAISAARSGAAAPAKKSFSRPSSRISKTSAGRAMPLLERAPALGGELVDGALPGALGASVALDQPGLGEALQLGVDLPVARGPEEAGRVVDELLDLVAGPRAGSRASRGSPLPWRSAPSPTDISTR